MSTVIKAGEAGPILNRLSTVDLADHLAEARAVVDAAQKRAAQIVSDAEAQVAGAVVEAREKGYEAGYREGREAGTRAGHQAAHEESTQRFNKEQGNIVAAMQEAVAEIDRVKDDLMVAARKDLLEFAVFMARKLTFAIGRLHRESAIENLNRALRLVGSKTDLTIRVHADDIASMEMFAKSVLEQADASRAINVAADETMAPGGCKVETDRTRVDATLESQVDELAALLLGGNASDA